MNDGASALETGAYIAEHRLEFIRDWKSDHPDKPLVGWVYTNDPEEIVHAAGLTPLRIFGDSARTQAPDKYLPTGVCAFARSYLDMALQGRYDFLDGLVMAQSCDTNFKVFDIYRRQVVRPPFKYFVHMPHVISSESFEFWMRELDEFSRSLAQAFDVAITDERLYSSIEVYNRHRALLKELYGLRKPDPPLVSGVEAFQLALASVTLPKEEANTLLEKAIQEIKTRVNLIPRRPRLLLAGSLVDNPAIVRTVEDAGANVVADTLCTGSRYFWDTIEQNGNPLRAIGRYHLERPINPWQHPTESGNVAFMQKMCEEFQVDGVVFQTMRFCDPYGFDAPLIMESLEKRGIPALHLHHNYNEVAWASLRNRLEAFVEMVSGV
ncbi:MAG: 2-hydroxyacyl-CoA dehydratase family protein [Chloroflexi bacterium]|nr:2-hydroxyacyl-CoA dehydratase family protein [Chloroflexota bacterium]